MFPAPSGAVKQCYGATVIPYPARMDYEIRDSHSFYPRI